MLQLWLTELLCREPIPFLSSNSRALTALSYHFEQVLPHISLYRKMIPIIKMEEKESTEKRFLTFASGLAIQTGEHKKRKKRDDPTGQNEPPFSTVHVISLKQTKHNLNPFSYLRFSGLHPKNTTPLQHFKIQFIHKTSELPWSFWLTKTEEKSAWKAEYQAWHTQEKTLRPPHPTTFTPLSELKLMLAKALIQQSHLVPTAPCKHPALSLMDASGDQRKSQQAVGLKQTIVPYPECT